MNSPRTLRIALMIACIFAAGIATGRYTTSAPSHDVPAQFSGSAGRVITPRAVMMYFDQRFNLSPGQKQALLGEAREFVGEIARTESATKERFDVFHRYYPRVRVLLSPDQHPAFDEMVKTHEARMEAILKEVQIKKP